MKRADVIVHSSDMAAVFVFFCAHRGRMTRVATIRHHHLAAATGGQVMPKFTASLQFGFTGTETPSYS
jgi:hypothetical protein